MDSLKYWSQLGNFPIILMLNVWLNWCDRLVETILDEVFLIQKAVAVAKWLARLTDMREVSRSNPASHHCCGEAISCHGGHKEVGRRHPRGKSLGMYITYASIMCEQDCPLWLWKSEETSQEVQNQGYQWPHKKDLVPSKNYLKYS